MISSSKVRINISLPKTARMAIKRLAKRDSMPEATKAAEMLSFAIEIEEDIALGKIAKARDVKGAKFIKHSVAWK